MCVQFSATKHNILNRLSTLKIVVIYKNHLKFKRLEK